MQFLNDDVVANKYDILLDTYTKYVSNQKCLVSFKDKIEDRCFATIL